MTEVTPPLENTRFSSIFEYNRFMTPRLYAGGFFALRESLRAKKRRRRKYNELYLIFRLTYNIMWG